MAQVDDDKYVVFKREDFMRYFNEIPNLVSELEVKDAVVMRRQDKFASPCLLTYASMMAMVAEDFPNPDRKAELLAIADYFHRQGVLAGEEGYKYPTL